LIIGVSETVAMDQIPYFARSKHRPIGRGMADPRAGNRKLAIRRMNEIDVFDGLDFGSGILSRNRKSKVQDQSSRISEIHEIQD
jgi:hypothetical protein